MIIKDGYVYELENGMIGIAGLKQYNDNGYVAEHYCIVSMELGQHPIPCSFYSEDGTPSKALSEKQLSWKYSKAVKCLGKYKNPETNYIDLKDIKQNHKYLDEYGEVHYVISCCDFYSVKRAIRAKTGDEYRISGKLFVMDLGAYEQEELDELLKPKLELKVGHKYLNEMGCTRYIVSKDDEGNYNSHDLFFEYSEDGKALTGSYDLVEDLGEFTIS